MGIARRNSTETLNTLKQKRFVEQYIIDFNGTRAATDAGYSPKTAYSIASELLKKPEIKEAIDLKLKEAELSVEATGKMIADIAKGNVNNYIKTVQVEFTPRIKKGLAQLIQEINEEMAFEDEYASGAGFNEEEWNDHYATMARLERKKLRYKLELDRNPKAFRIVDGQTVLVDAAELDLVALSKDKENGKIKSFSMTKDGPKVELYPADAALRDIARMHGMFKDKLDVNMNGNIDPDKWLEANNTGDQKK